MKYVIDTDAGTCMELPEEPNPAACLAVEFERCIGAKEWDATVRDIQEWYYGSVVKDHWCATAVSYFSELAGKEHQTGKHENVDAMKDFMNSYNRLDCTKNYGGGHYTPKRGDIVFMSVKHTYADCTHVGVITAVNPATGSISVISGNSDDKIQITHGNYLADMYYVAFGQIL